MTHSGIRHNFKLQVLIARVWVFNFENMNSASASNRIIKLIVYRVDTRYSKAASWSMYPTPKDSIKVSAYLMRHFREKSIFLQLFYFCTIFHRLLFTPWKVSVFGVVFVSFFFFQSECGERGNRKLRIRSLFTQCLPFIIVIKKWSASVSI